MAKILNFQNKIVNGIQEEYWSNGKVKSKGNYLNGKMAGYWEEY